MKYVIIKRHNSEELERVVEVWINKDGWKLHGAPFMAKERKLDPRPHAGTVFCRYYCQCVIKEE